MLCGAPFNGLISYSNSSVCPDYRLPTDDRELRDSAVPFVEQVSRLDRIGFRFVSAFPEGA
jgi:hypothetical protein